MQPPPSSIVIDALRHRHVTSLPRGELFLEDFAGHHFGSSEEDHVGPVLRAAESLGLSLVGVDLNHEWSGALLARLGYTPLQKFFTTGFINGPVSRLIDIHGFRDAMLSTRKKPELFSGIAAQFIRDAQQTVRLARSNGFSAIALADDIAGNRGLLFPPTYFADIVLPVYREFASLVKGEDLHVFIHSDGDMKKVIDLLIDAGYDCLHPVDGQAGMNLPELKKDFGERICFMGHIDLLGWDVERICREISDAESLFSTGGLILGSTGGIPINVEEEKLCALYPQWAQRVPGK